MGHKRGMGLAGVLVVTMMCFVLCSVLVGTTLLHFRVAQHGEDELLAQGLAEEAVGLALDRINKDPQFGLPGKAGFRQPVEPRPAWARADMSSRLIFGSSGCFSTNNLYQDTATRGWNGTVVPARSLHLVAIGKVGSTERVVEVQYQNNPFPYAVGSNSPLVSEGDLLVGSLPEGKVHSLTEPPPDDQLKPGHLRSNSAAQESVALSDRTLITGNVESAGGIKLDKDTRVLGAARPFAGTTRFPEIDVHRFDPGSEAPKLSSQIGPETLEGRFRADRSLRVDGDLTLQDGVLYVDGDVHISGGLKGKGAIVCTGKLTVERASNFAQASQVALLANGDLELHGQGSDRSYVQGLIYAKGSVKTSDLTLMGSLIQSGRSDGQVDVSNSHLVHVPEYSKMRIDFAPPPQKPPATVDAHLDNANMPSLLRSYNGGQNSDFVGIWPSYSLNTFYDAAQDRYVVPPDYKNQMLISFGSATYVNSQQTSWSNPNYSLAQARNLATDPRWAAVIGQTGMSLDGLVNLSLQRLTAQVEKADQQYQLWKAYQQPTQSGSRSGGPFVLDLNEFLSPGDRLRLLRWHRL
ncbi:hypothetical protein JST97_19870 [bacterium]|nr:hypothetical protein [bacterium]